MVCFKFLYFLAFSFWHCSIELLLCYLISLFPRLKLNHGNFRIEIPASDVPIHHPSIPKNLIEQKAYSPGESKGRPIISPQRQKVVESIAIKNMCLFIVTYCYLLLVFNRNFLYFVCSCIETIVIKKIIY